VSLPPLSVPADGIASAAAEPPQWIEVCPGVPYFLTEQGAAWTPIGHNDAVGWPELDGLFRRRDVPAVRRHLRWLKAHGVTCIRLMLEYAQGRHRYLERPVGRFVPNMVQLWDDLFALCEEVGLHVLLTPFDTFFTWRAWRHHPYSDANGGPCFDRSRLITCPRTRAAIKARLEFASRRWGGSAALFAWDLWNELDPAYGNKDVDACKDFVADLGDFLRALELRVHGRAHLQTVSTFALESAAAAGLHDSLFKHPRLEFANPHFYERGAIDDPRDTVAPAIAVGQLMRQALAATPDLRPVFDSEHGPIHAFADRHRILPEAFDDEYFRHCQWAHLASGGAGGGMRWPYRHPHVLTAGMRRAQWSLGRFLSNIDWRRFRRVNLNEEARASAGIQVFACGDAHQALAWLLRVDCIGSEGRLRADAPPLDALVRLPGLAAGGYRIVLYDTRDGRIVDESHRDHGGGELRIDCAAVRSDVAVAVVGRALSSADELARPC
jgi:hypothetical protein